jgi:hypothetical protein
MHASETLRSLKGTPRKVAGFLLAHPSESFTAMEIAHAVGMKRPPFAALGTLVRLGIAEGEGGDDGRADKFLAHSDFVQELEDDERAEMEDASAEREWQATMRTRARAAQPKARRGRAPVRRRNDGIGCIGTLAIILGLTGLILVAVLIYQAAKNPVTISPPARSP